MMVQPSAIASGTLPNGGFYQSAAALLGVLLLTGVVTEVRATRDQSAEAWRENRWNRRSLYGFLGLSVIVLVGELAALTVLLRQEASTLLQVIVGLSLILRLVGVPGLVFLGVARDVVGTESVNRGFKIAAQVATSIALVVVGAFVLPSLFTGKPGVGTPTPAIPFNGSEESLPTVSEVCARPPPPSAIGRRLAKELEELWVGPEGAGATTAGCMGQLHLGGRTGTVWIEGRNPRTGRLLSLAIAGRYRPALLFGDAAAIGLSLLARGELLGASSRMPRARRRLVSPLHIARY